MIRVLIWKEYREHWSIWLAMAVVSSAGLYGLLKLIAPGGVFGGNGTREMLLSVAVLLSWAYGLVCGSMLLANESEMGTMTFLDALPMRRMELWLIKTVFGFGLLLAQLVVLIALVMGLHLTETSLQWKATVLSMVVFGAFGMAWGLLFSARGENVLNVIGLAILGQIVAGFAVSVMIAPLVYLFARIFLRIDSELIRLSLVLLGAMVLTIGPLVGSMRLFTQLDRQRGRMLRILEGEPPRVRIAASWHRLLWLSYAQMRRLAVGLLVCALLFGLLLPVMGPMGWPILTLLFGVLCGVTVWTDEQFFAAFRFLGDQRLPLGRVWIVKVGSRFSLAVGASFLLLLPSLILALYHRIAFNGPLESRSPFLVDALHCSLVGSILPAGLHLTIWLLYGFTVGQVCGLLFRKSLVAAVVALGCAGLLVSLWLPSLLGVGLHFWQIVGAPVLLLLASVPAMPAWTAERLLARRPLTRLGVILTGAILWIIGGVAYRVVEIPNVPDTLDMPAFIASVPTLDVSTNAAGLQIRVVWNEASKDARALSTTQPGKQLFPDDPQVLDKFSLMRQLDKTLARGFPRDKSDLGAHLDRIFRHEWPLKLADAANQPLGAVEDVRQLTVELRFVGSWHHASEINGMLAARGLQQQTRGDPAAFVDHLRTGLAVTRNIENCAPLVLVWIGRNAETVWIMALDPWLENLKGHPELLERVRDILLHHETELPSDLNILKAEYLIATNSLEQTPDRLVEVEVTESLRHPPGDNDLRRAEINLTALLWRMPWETERHERLLSVAFQGQPRDIKQAEKSGGATFSNCLLTRSRIPGPNKRQLADSRAALLKVALRLYEARNGKLPDNLMQLVPKYLPSLPLDPFDGKPFRYRVSLGENLGLHPDGQGGFQQLAPAVWPNPREPKDDVPTGQAILWSVGADGVDHGGTRRPLAENGMLGGDDLIYLVPLPTK